MKLLSNYVDVFKSGLCRLGSNSFRHILEKKNTELEATDLFCLINSLLELY